MKMTYRIQIETKDKTIYFCDVKREKDVTEIIDNFNKSENTNKLKLFGKLGNEFCLLEKINKVKMGF
jgi:hypothetical protein